MGEKELDRVFPIGDEVKAIFLRVNGVPLSNTFIAIKNGKLSFKESVYNRWRPMRKTVNYYHSHFTSLDKEWHFQQIRTDND